MSCDEVEGGKYLTGAPVRKSCFRLLHDCSSISVGLVCAGRAVLVPSALVLVVDLRDYVYDVGAFCSWTTPRLYSCPK